MKKTIVLLLIVIVSVSMAFGAGEKEGAAVKPVVLQVGYENNPGEPIDLACIEWQKIIDEKSQGTMKIELFPSSQLGKKTDIIDQMMAGSAVCTLADGAFYAERGVPDFGIVFGPYLFNTWEDCWKLTESDWYADQSSKLEANGLKIISSNWIYGDRHTLTKKQVKTPDDLKGMKIRVANSMVFIKGFASLGATPTPLALGEVYTALQQGVVDGLENPLTTLDGGKFQEVAKYLILDGHIKNFTTFVVGTKFFNGLTEDQQNILIESAHEAGLYNNSIQQKKEQEAMDNLVAGGVKVYTPTNEEKKLFQNASEKFYTYPEIADKWTPGLYEKVKAIIYN